MKRKITLIFFVLTIFLFIAPFTVKASTTYVNCTYSLNNMTQSHHVFGFCKDHKRGGAGNEYLLYVDMNLPQNIEEDWIAYIFTEGRWYGWENGGYPKAEKVTGTKQLFMYYPYNNIGNFIWKGAVLTDEGKYYLCSNNSEPLHIYLEESPKNNESFGRELVVENGNSYSFRIYPTRGENVGGTRIRTDFFYRDTDFDPDCACEGASCGYFQIAPHSEQFTKNLDEYIKKAFCDTPPQEFFEYKIQSANCTGSIARGAILNEDVMYVYSRPAVVPTDPPNPSPPPGVTIHGYVRDKNTNNPIPNSPIRIDTSNGMGGYIIGTSSLTTDSDGRWSETYGSGAVPSSIRIHQESNTSYGCGPCTTSQDCTPGLVSGTWIIDENNVGWNNPSGGPITFYDNCSSLPTPTPTSVPPCPLYAPLTYEGGVTQTGLNNTYSQYVPFTPSINGMVNKISVKAGNYGAAWRNITCKVTNSNGTNNISVEKSSAEFRSTDPDHPDIGWRDIDFTGNGFNLTAGTQYRLYCKGPDSWNSIFWVWGPSDQLTQKTRRIYMCEIPPTPSPTIAPWKKIKDGSFHSTQAVNNIIPPTVLAYDVDDDTGAYFVTGEEGVVTAPSTTFTADQASEEKWYKSGYSSNIRLGKDEFLSYIKSKKQYKTITDLSQIESDGTYYIRSSVTFVSSPDYNFVLVVDGDVNIDHNTFNVTDNNSIAIIADTINFASTVTEARGVFAATTVNTGTNNNLGLKIRGNLSTATLNNNRGQSSSGNARPSVFIVFDPHQFVGILPYLSISKYEWTQLK